MAVMSSSNPDEYHDEGVHTLYKMALKNAYLAPIDVH